MLSGAYFLVSKSRRNSPIENPSVFNWLIEFASAQTFLNTSLCVSFNLASWKFICEYTQFLSKHSLFVWSFCRQLLRCCLWHIGIKTTVQLHLLGTLQFLLFFLSSSVTPVMIENLICFFFSSHVESVFADMPISLCDVFLGCFPVFTSNIASYLTFKGLPFYFIIPSTTCGRTRYPPRF